MARQVVVQKSRAYFKRFQVKYRRRRSAFPYLQIVSSRASQAETAGADARFPTSRSGQDRLPVRGGGRSTAAVIQVHFFLLFSHSVSFAGLAFA